MIFDIKVSWFKSAKATVPGGTVRLLDCLNPAKLADRVFAIRAESDKEKRTVLKSQMPCFTPSGLFKARNASGLMHHSGFLCFDVDAADNPGIDFTQARDHLQDIPEIAFAALSVSGRGLFFLIQLDTPPKSADAHSAAYKALVPTFEKMTGLKLDATSDVCRLRFMTYDPDAWGWLEPTPVSIPKPAPKPIYQKYILPTDTDGTIRRAHESVVREHGDFTPGNRHFFVKYLACSLAGRGVPRHEAEPYLIDLDPNAERGIVKIVEWAYRNISAPTPVNLNYDRARKWNNS